MADEHWIACQRIVDALYAEGCNGPDADPTAGPRAWVEGGGAAGPWVALVVPNLVGTFWGWEVEDGKHEWFGSDTEGIGIGFGPIPDDQPGHEVAKAMLEAVKMGGN